MAHIWTYSPSNWTPRLLDGELFTLSAAGAPPIQPLRDGELAAGHVAVRRTTDADGVENWLLLAPPCVVWVNGRSLFAGAHLLRDKDEIRLHGAEPMFFSTEAQARVTEFPGAVRAAHCPRCRQVIEKGSPSVQCPGCRMWHHQAEGCECWTYAATCATCDCSTALDAGYRWTPEEPIL
jgi:hypothetical protein